MAFTLSSLVISATGLPTRFTDSSMTVSYTHLDVYKRQDLTQRSFFGKEEMSMKIVVLDGYTENPGDLSWKDMEALGELTVYDRTSLTDMQEVIDRIGDAEAVITNKTPLPREVFDACRNIRYVGVLATGYNVVDVETAKERGIPVCNIPTYGTAAVGQFAIALLLEICHHIGLSLIHIFSFPLSS